MNKLNSKKNAFSLIELTIVIVVMALLFAVFSASEKVVEHGRLINAINLTAQQPNIIESNRLVLWLETSMSSREKKVGQKLLDWDDLSKNKILFTASNTSHPQTFEEKRIFPGIKSVHFDGSNPMESKKGLNLLSYTAFVVSKPEKNNTGTILDSGFKITSDEVYSDKNNDSLINVIRNDGSTKSIKKGIKGEFVGTNNNDVLGNRPEKIYIGNNVFKGEIFEIIIFDGVLEEDEIYEIETYLHRKYIN